MGNGHLEQGKIGRGGEVRRGQVDIYVQDGLDGVVMILLVITLRVAMLVIFHSGELVIV